MSLFGLVLLSKWDVAFILPQKAKHSFGFFFLSSHDFFHLQTGSSTHWWSLKSFFFGFHASYAQKRPEKNLARKEPHRLEVHPTVQSSLSGCLSNSNCSINMLLKSFFPSGKKTTHLENGDHPDRPTWLLKPGCKRFPARQRLITIIVLSGVLPIPAVWYFIQ